MSSVPNTSSGVINTTNSDNIPALLKKNEEMAHENRDLVEQNAFLVKQVAALKLASEEAEQHRER